MFDTTGICLICLHTNKRLKVIDQRMSDFHYALCDYDSVTTLGNQYCVECAYLLNKVYNFTAKCQLALKILQGEYKTKCKKNTIYTLLPSNGMGLWDENEISVYHYQHCEETAKPRKNSSRISNKDYKQTIDSIKDFPSVKPDDDLQLLVIPNIFTEELIPKTVILIQSIVDSNKHVKNIIASTRGVQDVFVINKSIQNNAESNKSIQNIFASNILIQNPGASNFIAHNTADAKMYTQTIDHNSAKILVQNRNLNPNVHIIIKANESREELKDPLSVDEDIKLENEIDSEVDSSETDLEDEVKDKEKENTSEGTDDMTDDIDINEDFESNQNISEDIPYRENETNNNAENTNESSPTSYDIPKYTLRKRTAVTSRENVTLTAKNVIQTRNNDNSLNSRTNCDPVKIVSNYTLRKRKNLEKEKNENDKNKMRVNRTENNYKLDTTVSDTDTIISNASLRKRKTVMEENKKGKHNTGVSPAKDDDNNDTESDNSITKDIPIRKSVIRDEQKKGESKTEVKQTRNTNSTDLESDIKETSIDFDDHDYLKVTEIQKGKANSMPKPSQVPKKVVLNEDSKEQNVLNRRRTRRVAATKIQRSVRKRKISGDSIDDSGSLCVVPKQCKSIFKNTKEVYDKERLKADLMVKFSACGELRTEDGFEIDKQCILDIIENKPPDLRMRQLWHSVINIPTLNSNALNNLKLIQVKYNKDFEAIFEIQYLNTEQKVVAEFNKRKLFESYVNAKYKCELCYLGFEFEKRLEHHMKLHDEKTGDHVCPVCETRWRNKKVLFIHMSRHRRVFKCKMCPMVTNYRNSMENHYELHMGVQFQCEKCGAHLNSRSSLNTHRTTFCSSNEYSEVCARCGRTFANSAGLMHHINVKHRNDPPIDESSTVLCSHCPLKFVTKEVCIRHIMISHPELAPAKERKKISVDSPRKIRKARKHVKRKHTPQTCPLCNKVGKHYWWLQSHFKTEHPTVDTSSLIVIKHPLLCELCGKGFKSNFRLSEHMNTHTGNRAFACEQCPARFFQAVTLRRHKLIHLTPAKCCPHCGKKCRTTENLDKHLRTHVGYRPQKCNICDKRFMCSNALTEHVQEVHSDQQVTKRVSRSGPDRGVSSRGPERGVSSRGPEVTGSPEDQEECEEIEFLEEDFEMESTEESE